MENVEHISHIAQCEYRAILQAWELEKLQGLLNESFEVPENSRFLDDFPVWNPKYQAGIEQLGCFVGAQLIGSASVRIAELNAPHLPCRVALVGGVAVETAFRGQGIASRLIDECVKHALAQKASVIFLWGSEHSLYRKQGFELCGMQNRFALGAMTLPEPAGWREIHMGWNDRIFDLIRTRKSGLKHSVEDLAWFSAHQNVEWYWIGPENDPKAYLAYNRGIDLRGMIHEWGGDPAELAKLLSFMKTKLPELQIMGNVEVFSRSSLVVPESDLEFLCMAKILDVRALMSAFMESAELPDCFTDSSLSDSELVQVVFGPAAVSGIETDVLPLPLWIWGLDSA